MGRLIFGMLTDGQLLELLRGDESDRVEFTSEGESERTDEKIRRNVCAFSNDLPGHSKPGVLFIGVNDDGSCAGMPVTRGMMEKLSELRLNAGIHPFPVVAVSEKTLNDCRMAVVEVEPSHSPPVSYNRDIWVRVGPTCRKATREEEAFLIERRRGKPTTFDTIAAVPQAGIGDLDIGVFHEYLRMAVSPEALAENDRTDEERLKSMGFMTPEGEANYAALLCFGKDPQRWLGGAYIQFARFPGTDISSAADTDDHKKIGGTIFNQLRVVEELLKGLITTSAVIGEERRIDTPDYPFVALQQVIRNAALHRAYEGTNAPVRCYWFGDRVEIRSPGGPYGKVTEKNFGREDAADYRNPKLAEAMLGMKLIERFGYGIGTTKRAMENNGNPPPEFKVDDSFVTVALRKSPGREFRLSPKTIVSLAQFLHLFGNPGYQLLGKHGIDRRSTGGGIEAMLDRAAPEQLRELLDEIGRTKMALQRQMVTWEVERERRDLEDEDAASYKARLGESRETAKAVFTERFEDLQFCLREDGFRFRDEGEKDRSGLIPV